VCVTSSRQQSVGGFVQPLFDGALLTIHRNLELSAPFVDWHLRTCCSDLQETTSNVWIRTMLLILHIKRAQVEHYPCSAHAYLQMGSLLVSVSALALTNLKYELWEITIVSPRQCMKVYQLIRVLLRRLNPASIQEDVSPSRDERSMSRLQHMSQR
jgi:hypothetical protein